MSDACPATVTALLSFGQVLIRVSPVLVPDFAKEYGMFAMPPNQWYKRGSDHYLRFPCGKLFSVKSNLSGTDLTVIHEVCARSEVYADPLGLTLTLRYDHYAVLTCKIPEGLSSIAAAEGTSDWTWMRTPTSYYARAPNGLTRAYASSVALSGRYVADYVGSTLIAVGSDLSAPPTEEAHSPSPGIAPSEPAADAPSEPAADAPSEPAADAPSAPADVAPAVVVPAPPSELASTFASAPGDAVVRPRGAAPPGADVLDRLLPASPVALIHALRLTPCGDVDALAVAQLAVTVAAAAPDFVFSTADGVFSAPSAGYDGLHDVCSRAVVVDAATLAGWRAAEAEAARLEATRLEAEAARLEAEAEAARLAAELEEARVAALARVEALPAELAALAAALPPADAAEADAAALAAWRTLVRAGPAAALPALVGAAVAAARAARA